MKGCLVVLLVIGGIICLFYIWPVALILWALAFIVSVVGKNK